MVIHVTLLAEEWTQSTKGGTLSTFNRQLGIHLAQHPDVEVGLFILKCSLEDKQDAEKYHINVFEPEELPDFYPFYWLAFPGRGFATDFVIGHDVKLEWQGEAMKHRSPHCKWIHMVHSNTEEIGMHKNFSGAISTGQIEQRKLCESADMVVTIGPKIKDSFSSSLSFSGKEIIFNLTPGIFDEFCNLRIKDSNFQERKTFHLLIFGRGDAEDFELKGFDVAAKAVAALDDSTYRLIVVGAPDGMQEELATKLCSHGISRNQLVVRRFTKDRINQMSDLFYEVDLLLMPSATEPFGLAALEALSAGLPILVTSNSGLAEALREVPLGSHCIVDSDADWTKEIKKAHKQLKTRQEEAKILRESYKEKYSWKEQCARLVEEMMSMHPDNAENTQRKSSNKDGSSSAQKRHKVSLEEMDVDENEDRKMDENIKVKLENEKDTTLGIDGNKKTAIKRGRIIDKGDIWNLREAAASITYGAATPSLVISCSLWSPRALSPPLGSNEVLVSNVIELSHDGPPDLELSGDAKGNITVALLHSASNLKGYEVVIKQLVDPEYNEWKDLETKNIWDASARPGVPDWLFPFAEAPCTITRHSSFAAIWRLKSFTFSRPTTMASGFTFNVPDFPGVSVEIPTNFVPAGEDFCLTLKVQEFPSSEPIMGGIFISPVLHISCTQNVAFPLPATIKLPVRIPEGQELPQLFSVRILHSVSGDIFHEWDDITEGLEEPAAVSMHGVVAFKVRRFCRYWGFIPVPQVTPVLKKFASILSLRFRPQYVQFLTCLCETTVKGEFALKMYCYPSYLQGQVKEMLSKYNVPYQGEGMSQKPICKEDEILVTFLSAIIPQEEENVFLRFLGGEVFTSTDLMVCVGSDSAPQLKFVRSQDSLFLCRVIVLPTSPNREVASAATPQVVTEQKDSVENIHEDSVIKESPPAPKRLKGSPVDPEEERASSAVNPEEKRVFKTGTPSDSDLEKLANEITSCWKKLGRVLLIPDARLTAFERENPHDISEQAYKMLQHWKSSNGRSATYKVLFEALCDDRVSQRKLAEKYCCQK